MSYIIETSASPEAMPEAMKQWMTGRMERLDAWLVTILASHGATDVDAVKAIAPRCAIHVHESRPSGGPWRDEYKLHLDGVEVGDPLVIETTLVTR